jgi:hypothetical protein
MVSRNSKFPVQQPKTMVTLKPKFRLIWVYPVDMTISEGVFAQPLLRAYNSLLHTPYALWYRWHKADMQYLNRRLTPTTKWLGVDYSSFDVNVPAWLIRDAFDILREQLDFGEYEYYGKPTDPSTIDRLWKAVIDYFINTPIKMKSGKVVVKHSGVPSGSYFTGMVDSICNSIMTHYLLQRMNIKYFDHFFYGDDGLIRIGSELDLGEYARLAEGTFGAIVNGDKSEIGKYVTWLGYKLGPRYPEVNINKLIAQLLIPSKPDLYHHDIYVRARALAITSFMDPGFVRILEEYGLLTNISRSYRNEAIERLEYLGLDFNRHDIRYFT